MLNTPVHSQITNAHQSTIDLLGVPADWTQTKPTIASRTITVGFRNASARSLLWGL